MGMVHRGRGMVRFASNSYASPNVRPPPPPSPSLLTTHRSPLTSHLSPLTLTLTTNPAQIMFAFNAYGMSDNQQRSRLRSRCRAALVTHYDNVTANASAPGACCSP